MSSHPGISSSLPSTTDPSSSSLSSMITSIVANNKNDGDNSNSHPDEHVKIITEDKFGENKQIIGKITRKIRMKLIREIVKPQVAERRKWKKFGDVSNDGPGPNIQNTILGEPVFLKLSMDSLNLEDTTTKLVTEAKTITCKYCGGPHFTVKCQYKDKFSTVVETSASPAASLDSRKGKYVPPSQRGSAGGSGDIADANGSQSAGSSSAPGNNRDNPNTIRLTNLSENTTEKDIRLLCNPFGTIIRAFVSLDQTTKKCRGYAFVSFTMKEDADRALRKLDGHRYGSLVIKAEWAKPIMNQ